MQALGTTVKLFVKHGDAWAMADSGASGHWVGWWCWNCASGLYLLMDWLAPVLGFKYEGIDASATAS